MIRVFLSPDSNTIRYYWDDPDQGIFQVTPAIEGETESDEIPEDWPELTP